MKCYEGTIKVYINIDCKDEQELKKELNKMYDSFKGIAQTESNTKVELNVSDYDKQTEGYELIDL